MELKEHNDYIMIFTHDNREFFIVKDAYFNDESYIGYYIYYAHGKRYREKVLMNSLYGSHVRQCINSFHYKVKEDLEETNG